MSMDIDQYVAHVQGKSGAMSYAENGESFTCGNISVSNKQLKEPASRSVLNKDTPIRNREEDESNFNLDISDEPKAENKEDGKQIKANQKKDFAFHKFMEKQNSAVKGAMSLLSSVQPSVKKQKSGFPEQALNSRDIVLQWMNKYPTKSQLRTQLQQKIDLKEGCLMIMENFNLNALDLNLPEIIQSHIHSGCSYQTTFP